MNTKIDKIILEYNKKGLSQLEIAHQIPSDLNLNEDFELCLSYCAFLKSCGFYKELFQLIIKRIENKLTVPWFYLFFIVLQCDLEITERDLEKLFEDYSSPDDISFLLTSHCFNISSISDKRNQRLLKLYNESTIPQVHIERELKFCQSQKLLEKEEELLKQLIEIDKNNPIFQNKYLECRKTQAQQVFFEYKDTYSPNPLLHKNLEEKKTIQHLINVLEQHAKTHPHLREDFTVIIAGLGFPDLAAQFIEEHLDTPTKQELFLDLLIESNQFIKCLTYIEKLMLKENIDSTDICFLQFTKAKAYCGLQEFEQAKIILKDIVQTQPSHESAKDLLYQIEARGEAI